MFSWWLRFNDIFFRHASVHAIFRIAAHRKWSTLVASSPTYILHLLPYTLHSDALLFCSLPCTRRIPIRRRHKKLFLNESGFLQPNDFFEPRRNFTGGKFFFSYTVRYGVKVGLKIALYHGLQHEQWHEFVMIDHIRYDIMDRIDNQN